MRQLGTDEQYVRGYHFVMPFTQFRPGQSVGRGTERPVVSGHHWVPIDDDNCMVWNWHYSYGDYELSEQERSMDSSGNGPRHVDIHNGFRAVGNRRNGWLINREVQKTQTYSGIDGVNAQDRAVQESIGPVVNRSREHLGPADRAIIAARKLPSRPFVRCRKEHLLAALATAITMSVRQRSLARELPWRDVCYRRCIRLARQHQQSHSSISPKQRSSREPGPLRAWFSYAPCISDLQSYDS